jgi:hypothetical protein
VIGLVHVWSHPPSSRTGSALPVPAFIVVARTPPISARKKLDKLN